MSRRFPALAPALTSDPPMGSPDSRLARLPREIALDGEGPGGRTLILGDVIGRGSLSTVTRGFVRGAHGLERAVAVKVFDALTADEDGAPQRLREFARSVAGLTHPNLVAVEDLVLVDGNRPLVVTELVEGVSLSALCASYGATGGRVPLDVALFVGVEVAEALEAARTRSGRHGASTRLHGGLSSREVLLSRHGEVKVSDFGLQSATSVASGIRSVSRMAQRAATMAPEIVCGGEPTPRSDVFSLGVLLWEMLVGPRFADGEGDPEILAQAREGYVHTGTFDPIFPSALRRLLRRAVDADPRKRFVHAGALGHELRRIALAMGVGDGRFFVRGALAYFFGDDLMGDDLESTVARMPSGFAPARSTEVEDDASLPGETFEAEEAKTAEDAISFIGLGAEDDDDPPPLSQTEEILAVGQGEGHGRE